MIDPDNLPPQPEVLAKVLPPGSPVISSCRTCIRCHLQVPATWPKVCACNPPVPSCPLTGGSSHEPA